MERSNLAVKIIGARGLRAADFGGKSDPYATCELVGRPHTRIQTPHLMKTLEPTWNYEGTIERWGPKEVVEFAVYDYDRIGAPDLLGRVQVRSSVLLPGGGFKGDLTLIDSGNDTAVLAVEVALVAAPPPRPGEAQCIVNVRGAEGLRGADLGGKSDPYCICQLPGKPQSKFQTQVIYRSVNPVWNEEAVVDGYEVGDSLEFQVYDYDVVGSDDKLGAVTLRSEEFYPRGFEGKLPLGSGTLSVSVEVIPPPPPPRPADPGEHVGPDDLQPVPFQLRSLETGQSHRLVGYTQIGRDANQLNRNTDLVLRTPGSRDVSRLHAVVKAWCSAAPNEWSVRVYDLVGHSGVGMGPGGGHAGGGTCVLRGYHEPGMPAAEPVDPDVGTELLPGNVVRFGINELWILERSAMQQRSQLAEIACSRAQVRTLEDPAAMREFNVPSQACHFTLQRCDDWISLVRVILECRDEQDEPPCADCIEVRDECGKTVSRHEAPTFEAQGAYDVASILRDVHLGTTLRLRLSSDPCLLAPIQVHLEAHRAEQEEVYKSREEFVHWSHSGFA